MQFHVNAKSLSDGLERLLTSVKPQERRRMARSIAISLRAMQSDNILANLEPDGSKMAPRLPQRRAKRKTGKMFQKLGRRRQIKARYNANRALVQFEGANRRIANIHHYGLKAKVSSAGPYVRYRERQLLGISDRERQLVKEHIYKALAGERF